jgi:energy-coupling factor transport system ATP-binding protein
MTNPIIIACNLSYTYLPGPLAQVALADVSLEIARGSCVAIIGVTGSGKSTLVQHFNGLLRPTSGELIVDGLDLAAPELDLRTLRQRVGMLFQSPEAQLFAPTVLADVAFGPRRAGLDAPAAAERAMSALEQVGLAPQVYAMRSPFDLSGGQMRRVALAGVLALHPSVLVLDEPTVGLDAAGRAEFYRYAQRARHERGVTLILITHDMAEVAALADWLVMLHAGRLVAQGPPDELFAQGEQLRAWGLAAPPLAELLERLRQGGIALPPNLTSVEHAVAALRGLNREPFDYAQGRRRKSRKERKRRSKEDNV